MWRIERTEQKTGDCWPMHSPESRQAPSMMKPTVPLILASSTLLEPSRPQRDLLGVDDVHLVGRAEAVAGRPERVRVRRAVGVALVLAVVELVVGHATGSVLLMMLNSAVGRDAGKEDAGEQRADARIHLVGVHVAQRIERVGDVRGTHLAQDFEGGLC